MENPTHSTSNEYEYIVQLCNLTEKGLIELVNYSDSYEYETTDNNEIGTKTVDSPEIREEEEKVLPPQEPLQKRRQAPARKQSDSELNWKQSMVPVNSPNVLIFLE